MAKEVIKFTLNGETDSRLMILKQISEGTYVSYHVDEGTKEVVVTVNGDEKLIKKVKATLGISE